MEKFIKMMEMKWSSLSLDENRTVMIENRAIEGSKKIVFAFFELESSIRENVSFLLEKGETNDVLRAVFAAFARHRPSVICSRDPGLLSLLRNRGMETNGTTLKMTFPDNVVKIKDEYVPLVLLLNRYFEDKARSLIDDEKQMKEPEQNVVFDSTYGGYRQCGSDSRTCLLHVCRGCHKTNASLACDECSYTFYCGVRCALDNEELHSDECESFCEHCDNAFEVDLKSGEVFAFKGTDAVAVFNRQDAGYVYNGLKGVVDMKRCGGSNNDSYMVKLYSVENSCDDIPVDPVWICEKYIVPEDKIHFTVSEFARIQSNLVRMTSTALIEDVDTSEKDFETFLSHVEDSIVSGESHVEKGEYEIATEKYDKTLVALKRFDVRMISCTDEKDTISRFVRLKNAVASLLSSRASCFVMSYIDFGKVESKLHRAIRECHIGLEGKEHIKSDVVETLEYWIDQARKNIPAKEDGDEDIPAKEDHDEIEDTPIGDTKKESTTTSSASKKRRRRRRKKNKKRK